MKASELRIHNLVNAQPFNGNITVFNNDKCVVKHKTGIVKYFIKDLQPIPLTDEWLLKFGFEMEYSQLTNIYKYSLPNTPFGYSQERFNVFTQTGCFSVEIKYVHQLQNLYFALTGEELTINL